MKAHDKFDSQMKMTLIFLILFFSSLGLFAQSNTGIAVQGIARDAEKAALGDEILTFTFQIKDAGGTPYYTESVQIKTDPYGVFSHIIGTGSSTDGKKFNEIPFRQSHMRLVITVTYDGATVEISDSPFQYAPYAISADNGVPTGTIVAFAGTEVNIPKGWVLCDGRDLGLIDGSANLIALLESNNAPDLRGMFLRGTGTSPVNSQPGPALRATQDDGFEDHSITGSTDTESAHSHPLMLDTGGGGNSGGGNMITAEYGSGVGANNLVYTNGAGAHSHTVTGSSENGIAETRPVNYGINYIIKL